MTNPTDALFEEWFAKHLESRPERERGALLGFLIGQWAWGNFTRERSPYVHITAALEDWLVDHGWEWKKSADQYVWFDNHKPNPNEPATVHASTRLAAAWGACMKLSEGAQL